MVFFITAASFVIFADYTPGWEESQYKIMGEMKICSGEKEACSRNQKHRRRRCFWFLDVSDLFPGSGAEENQHRQDFKTAEKHGKCQNDFWKSAVSGIARIWSDSFESRPNVWNTGQGRGEIAEETMLCYISAGIWCDWNALTVNSIKWE